MHTHTPPFVIDQTELNFTFLSPTTVRFASFSFAYNCPHRGKAEGGGKGKGDWTIRERRASDRSGISVRAIFFFFFFDGDVRLAGTSMFRILYQTVPSGRSAGQVLSI